MTACSASTSPPRRRPASSRSRGSTCCSSRASTPASRSSTSSTDAGQPLTAVLERSTYVPALDNAAYNGGDDFLGSARERLFGFINGQTGANNQQAQGFVHLIKDGHASEDASAGNTALIDALRHGGDLLNVFGDFPTLTDPRHAQAYSPLWDAQLGLWTDKAVKQGLNTRQIDENVRSSTSPPPGPTCSPASTRPPASPLRTARSASTSTARSSASSTRPRPPTSPSPSPTRSSRRGSRAVVSRCCRSHGRLAVGLVNTNIDRSVTRAPALAGARVLTPPRASKDSQMSKASLIR